MSRLGVLITICAFAAGTADGASEEDLARLETARALWQSVQQGDYRYRYQKYCECDRNEPKVTVVTVVEGSIDAVHHLFNDSDREVPAREGSLSDYWTIDDLFDKLDAAYMREATVRVNYDQSAGYPSLIYIDYLPDLIGEETDLRNIRLELP